MTPEELEAVEYRIEHRRDHIRDRRRLIAALREAWDDRDRLARWKAEATTVLSTWEAVWEALGKPGALGDSKATAALAEVGHLHAKVRLFANDALDIAAERDEARAALDRVRVLHAPVTWQEENPEGGIYEPGTGHDLPPFCRACSDQDFVDAIDEGEIIDLGSPLVYHPCPTIDAIDGGA